MIIILIIMRQIDDRMYFIDLFLAINAQLVRQVKCQILNLHSIRVVYFKNYNLFEFSNIHIIFSMQLSSIATACRYMYVKIDPTILAAVHKASKENSTLFTPHFSFFIHAPRPSRFVPSCMRNGTYISHRTLTLLQRRMMTKRDRCW